MASVPINVSTTGESPRGGAPAGGPPAPAGTASVALDSARCNLDTCARTAAELLAPLDRCSRCRTASYCSRECQTADWQSHKRTCTRPSTVPSSPAGSQHSFPNNDSSNFYNVEDAKTWLSSLPQNACYEAISDAYRLRMEEDEEPTSAHTEILVLRFMQFLELAMSNRVLPDTCIPQTVIGVATDPNGNACIYHPTDIIEKYNGNQFMLEKLRMVAERVYGRPARGH